MTSAVPKRDDPLDAMLHEFEALEPSRDPLQDWMVAHRDALTPLIGQRAAIDPARGILASAPTLEGVHRALEAAGLMDDESIIIVTVQ